MSAVSLIEAASEARARSKLALRKTYPEMPMPKRASSETAATKRLRILQTVPVCADAIAGIPNPHERIGAASFKPGLIAPMDPTIDRSRRRQEAGKASRK